MSTNIDKITRSLCVCRQVGSVRTGMKVMRLRRSAKDVTCAAGMHLVNSSCTAQSWNASVCILLPQLVNFHHVAGRC